MNSFIKYLFLYSGLVQIYLQLYGEKWNSSAPKFAANLGLSPLEPMKVTSSSTSSTLSTVDSDNIKGHKSILEVPAAQFDWNSSGLINPLDGKLKENDNNLLKIL